MNEEVVNLRKRLQDLHDSHTTGFVDDAEYARSRDYLERKLVDAVMRAELEAQQRAASEPAPAPAPPLQAGPRPIAPPAMVHEGRVGRRVAAGSVIVLLAAAAGAWWWSRAPAPAPASPDVLVAQAATEVPPPTATPSSGVAAVIPVPEPVASTAGIAGAISGTVTLDPSLAARVSPQDTLFVYARAVDGPPMPLAVLRKQVRDLPLQFSLDDTMATWPAARVSAYPRVVVTARVSKTGEGQPRPGDLEGHSPAVSAGVAGLTIHIATVVAK